MQALPSKKETATSKLWLYRSTVDFKGDANAGLIGPLIVTDPSVALPSKQPGDVAQTFIALFQVHPCPHMSCYHSSTDADLHGEGSPACRL